MHLSPRALLVCVIIGANIVYLFWSLRNDRDARLTTFNFFGLSAIKFPLGASEVSEVFKIEFSQYVVSFGKSIIEFYLHYCGSPTFRINSAKRGSERRESNVSSVFRLISRHSCS